MILRTSPLIAGLVPFLAAQAPVVNAPVAPEAVYVGLGGAQPGIAVIDMNGFGQGTGDRANTRFLLNPNLGRPGVHPVLVPGTSNLDCGGSGAVTLVQNDQLGTRLVEPPVLQTVGDMALGQPLDLVWNNDNVNRYAASGNQVNPATMTLMPGNTISVAPHPNPPRIVFPPPNPARGIACEEPSTTSSGPPFLPGRVMTTSPPAIPSALNMLRRGNPFSSNPGTLGLFDVNYEDVFFGPQPPPPSPPPPPPFLPFTSRQQIGHFLYAADRANQRVLVLNSNRFSVITTIAVTDPTSLAMSPNLKWLAVSNQGAGTVQFIDTDPTSATFHRVVHQVTVGRQPAGLAWQPEGEDLLVCNRGDHSLSIVSAATMQVRATLTRFLRSPIDVVVGCRQFQVGFDTWIYHALVLNGDGSVAVYASGPTPLGVDAMLGQATAVPFHNATAIQIDTTDFRPSCWITHQDAAGLGQVSRLQMVTSPPRWRSGPLHPPALRRHFAVTARLGGVGSRDLLSGNAPVDLAFDDIRNVGALPDAPSALLPWFPRAAHSGKGLVKQQVGSQVLCATPRFAFVALADVGRVDVFEIATGQKIRSLAAPGVVSLANYWRQ